MGTIPSNQYPSGVKKLLWERDVELILKSVTKAEAKIHAIKLSGNYNYNSLKDKLGPLKDYPMEKWKSAYEKKYLKQLHGFVLIILVNPSKNRNYLPFCYISIYPKKHTSQAQYKKFLIHLNNLFPELNVSQVEYAVDLMCNSPKDVRALFECIKKNLYIRSQRNAQTIGGQPTVPIPINGVENNRVYRIGKYYKAYERGLDSKKKGEDGWLYNDLGKVRMEYTADNRKLKEMGISTLDDLIRDPKFLKINWEKWLFRDFKSSRLPSSFENYPFEDGNLGYESFQLEHIQARESKKVKNIAKYVSEVHVFRELIFMLYSSMSEFHKQWSEEHQ